MQYPATFLVTSNPAVDFLAGCAQDAGIAADLPVPKAVARQGDVSAAIWGITILSVQNLAWEVWAFARDTGPSGVIATEAFLGRWTFSTADAVRVAGAGLYHYSKMGLDIPYRDLDLSGELHLLLVNRSAAAKNANATGAVKVTITLQPTTAW